MPTIIAHILHVRAWRHRVLTNLLEVTQLLGGRVGSASGWSGSGVPTAHASCWDTVECPVDLCRLCGLMV